MKVLSCGLQPPTPTHICGRNKKYHELIDYVPKKEFAKKFEHFKDAKNSRDYLNKFDWNYHIVVIVEEV